MLEYGQRAKSELAASYFIWKYFVNKESKSKVRHITSRDVIDDIMRWNPTFGHDNARAIGDTLGFNDGGLYLKCDRVNDVKAVPLSWENCLLCIAYLSEHGIQHIIRDFITKTAEENFKTSEHDPRVEPPKEMSAGA